MVKDLQIQPPDWVGDVIVGVVIIAFHMFLRNLRNVVLRRTPSWIIPLVVWLILSIGFLDFNMVRKVLKKVLPFVDHYVSESIGYLVVPFLAKLALWILMTVLCVWKAWTTKQNGPMGVARRLRATEILEGLYNTGYLMMDETTKIKQVLNNVTLPRREVASQVVSLLRTISIKGNSADVCVECRSLVKVILSNYNGGGGSGGSGGSSGSSGSSSGGGTHEVADDRWPVPLKRGPLQDLGDLNLTRMEESVRVWLRATQRNGKAKYANFNEISCEMILHFNQYCNTTKNGRELTLKDIEFFKNDFLIGKLKENITEAGLKLEQYKYMWQWYCEIITTLNSDASLKQAWNEHWIVGFVDRSKTEQILRKNGGSVGSVLFRFSSDVNNKKQFNLCASVLSKNDRIVHSLITPRPTLEERFLIPTVNRDNQGHLLHRTLRFKTFKDIFLTYNQWKIFQPSGVLIADAFQD